MLLSHLRAVMSFPSKVPNTDLKCNDLIVWKVIVYYSLYISSLEYFEYVKGKLIS